MTSCLLGALKTFHPPRVLHIILPWSRIQTPATHRGHECDWWFHHEFIGSQFVLQLIRLDPFYICLQGDSSHRRDRDIKHKSASQTHTSLFLPSILQYKSFVHIFNPNQGWMMMSELSMYDLIMILILSFHCGTEKGNDIFSLDWLNILLLVLNYF